jgi:uncharacterized protein (DUF305 family)
MKNVTLALALLSLSVVPSVAQDAHAGHGTATAPADSSLTAQLPQICLTAQAVSGEPMAMDHEMDQAHSDLMAGMDENNQLMMRAGMVEDLDIAFVCAMIPHHQSAINMAKAELKHGDNEWAKEMAQKIIDAQEAEIAEMTEWLEGQDTAE